MGLELGAGADEAGVDRIRHLGKIIGVAGGDVDRNGLNK